MNKKLLVVILPFCISSVYAQIGGKNAFDFLNIPSNTRSTALGGIQVSSGFEDINNLFGNPASVSDTLDNHASFNHTFYYGDIHNNTFAVGICPKKVGLLTLGVQYLNYGIMDAFDETGQNIGEFRANDYAITVGHSRTLGPFTMGLNMKMVGSKIDYYHATALLFDLGGQYNHPVQDFHVGLSIRNAGFLLSDYSQTSESTIPFDVRLGATYKPKHMPVRMTITGHNLTRGDITYHDPNSDLNSLEKSPGTFDKVMSHLIFSAEFLFSKNFQIRAGYNHMIRQEFQLESRGGAAGFSYGLMFRIKSFEMSYSRAHYSIKGAINQIGLAVNLNRYINKLRIN